MLMTRNFNKYIILIITFASVNYIYNNVHSLALGRDGRRGMGGQLVMVVDL